MAANAEAAHRIRRQARQKVRQEQEGRRDRALQGVVVVAAVCHPSPLPSAFFPMPRDP